MTIVKKIPIITTSFPKSVVGWKSPYPMVDMVTTVR